MRGKESSLGFSLFVAHLFPDIKANGSLSERKCIPWLFSQWSSLDNATLFSISMRRWQHPWFPSSHRYACGSGPMAQGRLSAKLSFGTSLAIPKRKDLLRVHAKPSTLIPATENSDAS
jgi:hypothetical protein